VNPFISSEAGRETKRQAKRRARDKKNYNRAARIKN
jgi:hypothetical protein